MSFKKLKVCPLKEYRKQKFWHLKSKKITGQKKKRKKILRKKLLKVQTLVINQR